MVTRWRESVLSTLVFFLRIDGVTTIWGAFEFTVYDCEYDLNEAECKLCAGTRLGIDWKPKEPTCIYSAEGCCNNDGFEYFMKESLANYQPGHITSYFFPRDDMIYWSVGSTPTPASGAAMGRCVWNGDYLVFFCFYI